jgi:hypothetical protein
MQVHDPVVTTVPALTWGGRLPALWQFLPHFVAARWDIAEGHNPIGIGAAFCNLPDTSTIQQVQPEQPPFDVPFTIVLRTIAIDILELVGRDAAFSRRWSDRPATRPTAPTTRRPR